MKTINRALKLLLAAALTLSLSAPAFAVSEEMRLKYKYSFEGDPLGLFLHEGRGYASEAIAALAESCGEDAEEYLYALARAKIITIFIRSANVFEIFAGPNYPNGNGDTPAAEAEKRTEEYADVSPEAWYYGAVTEVTAGGLMYGDDSGIFRPDAEVTAAEFAAILCRIYSLPIEVFGNVWYKPYIDAMTVAGLEFSSCTYERALEPLARGEAIEAVTVMLRARGGEPVRALTWDEVEDAGACGAFEDGRDWSAQALLDALNYGVIDGVNAAHRVNAASGLTRAELCRLLQNIGVTRAQSVDAYKANEIHRQYTGR